MTLEEYQAAMTKAFAAGDDESGRKMAQEVARLQGMLPPPPSGPTAPPPGAPAGPTPAQMADALKRGGYGQPSVSNPNAVNENELPQFVKDMSGGERALAGAGKAFYDVGRGVGNIVTDIAPGAAKYGFATRADSDEARKLDAPLMSTPGGFSGNMGGNVALFAPTALVPGANTVTGGAAIGAAAGAVQPVGENDSRTANMTVGAGVGGALPAALRAYKVGKAALVDPMTDAGRDRILGRVLTRGAANPTAAQQRLATAQGSTPGFTPTVGQLGDDAGLAALERAARSTNPQLFGEVEKSQRQAMLDALTRITGTPEKRQAAVTARGAATKPLYDEATRAVVKGDKKLAELLRRPDMKAAQREAEKLAANKSEKFSMTTPAPAPSPILDASGNPFTPAGALDDVTEYTGSGLQYLKMGLDDVIGPDVPGAGLQGFKRNAAIGTKKEYTDWLEANNPKFGEAQREFAALSRPINQMDVGQEFYNRFSPALSEAADTQFRTTPQRFAAALRDRDAVVKTATGRDMPLASVMDADQIKALEGVARDSAMVQAGNDLGRGAGSNTVQNLAMTNLSAEMGIPNWMAKSGLSQVAGGWLKRGADLFYGGVDDKLTGRLGEVMVDPKLAAQIMKQPGPTRAKLAALLRSGGQGLMLSSPAIMDANQ